MLLRIDNEVQIAKCQAQFESRLHTGLTKKIVHKFGHLGEAYEAEVFTDGDLWYFGQLAGEPANRYWNAFGLLKATQPGNIVVEINFPLRGTSRRISGVFGLELKTQKIVILHRGGVGGGREGIGKNTFLSWYLNRSPERLVEFDDQLHNPAKAIRVAILDSASFLQDLYSFVRSVYIFKEEGR
jgi:5-methylcytosine-specific restriction protein A